jgi:hypothetical protein
VSVCCYEQLLRSMGMEGDGRGKMKNDGKIIRDRLMMVDQ